MQPFRVASQMLASRIRFGFCVGREAVFFEGLWEDVAPAGTEQGTLTLLEGAVLK